MGAESKYQKIWNPLVEKTQLFWNPSFATIPKRIKNCDVVLIQIGKTQT